jgi:hypothetical protein
MKAGIADLGGTVLGGSAAEFEELIVEESEKWVDYDECTDLCSRFSR